MRQSSSSHQAVVRQSSGSRLAVIRQWLGSCKAVIGLLSACHEAIVKQSIASHVIYSTIPLSTVHYLITPLSSVRCFSYYVHTWLVPRKSSAKYVCNCTLVFLIDNVIWRFFFPWLDCLLANFCLGADQRACNAKLAVRLLPQFRSLATSIWRDFHI